MADPPTLIPITQLNELPVDAVAAAVQPLFESAPALARRLAARRPFVSYAALLEATEQELAMLTPAEQVEVLCSHPAIGERPEVVRARSQLSYAEQGYAGEAALPAADVARVYAELAELNARYREKFGFTFMIFVNGRPKTEVLAVLRERIERPRPAEIAEGLAAMVAIARDRLRKLEPAPPQP